MTEQNKIKRKIVVWVDDTGIHGKVTGVVNITHFRKMQRQALLSYRAYMSKKRQELRASNTDTKKETTNA